MLAVGLGWLFDLDVDVQWAACLGPASLLLQPWLSLHFGPLLTTHAFPDLVMGGAVAAAFLGIAQAMSNR